MRTETVTKAKHEPEPAAADKPGVPHPVTGEPGPPGTTGWVENMPVNDAGMDMHTYHATLKARAARDKPAPAPAAKPTPEPES